MTQGSSSPMPTSASRKATVPSSGDRILNRREERLENTTPPVTEANSKKMNFVPTPLAESHILKVTSDFANTNLKHSKATEQLLESHRITTEHYVGLIKRTKEQAVQVIDAHKLAIHQEREKFKTYKSETEASIASLKEDILKKQNDIIHLEESYVKDKFTNAMNRHHMKDEADGLKKKVVGDKLMHGADHAHEEDIIESQATQIMELEDSIMVFREKVVGLESQLEKREGSLENLTKDYNTSKVEWIAKSNILTNQLKSKSTTIAEKEIMLSELGATLMDKIKTIEEKESALEGLGVDLSTANKTLEERQAILKEFGQKLLDKSSTIAEKTALIEERENKIAVLTESQNAANKSVAEKQRQLDELNAAVRSDREAHNAAKVFFEASIADMEQRVYEAGEETNDAKKKLDVARENDKTTAYELTGLQTKYEESLHSSSMAESQLDVLQSNMESLSSTKEELEGKLKSAERELKTAELRDKQGKATRAAAQAVSLLQVTSIERAEDEASEKARQLEEAESNLEEIKRQMEACKKGLEGELDKTSAGYLETKKALTDLKAQFAETSSFAQQKQLEKESAERAAEEIEEKLQERADEAEKSAQELREKLENLLKKGEEEESQEVAKARKKAQEAQSKAAFLSSQLDMIGKRESEIQAAKNEAEANVDEMLKVVEELREQIGSSGSEVLEAEETLRREREKAAGLEGKLKGFEAKQQEDLVMFKKLRDELDRREAEHKSALEGVAKKEREQLEKVKGDFAHAKSEAQGVKDELENEARALSEKVVEISKQFLENKDEGIIARKSFEKKVKQMLKEIEAGQERGSELAKQLTELGEKSDDTIKKLEDQLALARKERREAMNLKDKAESRLKQVQWLRSEELKKYGFTGKKVGKKKGARRKVRIGSSVASGGGRLGGKAEGGKAGEVEELKKQNEALKRSLRKSQMENGKVVAGSAEEKVEEAAKKTKKELVDEAKVRYADAKAETAVADEERKKVKGKIKTWLKEFEEKNGQSAGSGDKEEILGKYKALKELEGRVKELKELEKSLKEKAKELKELPEDVDGEDGGAERNSFNEEAARGASVAAEAARAFSQQINSLTEENEDFKRQISEVESERAEKEELLKKTEKAKKDEEAKAKEREAKLTERIQDIREHGDAALKHDIEVAEKRANEFRDKALAAQTTAKQAEFKMKDLEERTKRAEEELKEMVDSRPSSSSEEVNALRMKVEALQKEVKVKGKASIAGWEKLAEVEEECDRKLDEIRQEGLDEGEERGKMKVELQKQQLKLQGIELDGLKEKIDREKEKAGKLREELFGAQKAGAEGKRDLEEQLESLKKQIAEEAAEVGLAKELHSPRDSGGKKDDKDDRKEELPKVLYHEPPITGSKIDGVIEVMHKAVKEGTALWKAKKKSECFNAYKEVCSKAIKTLPRTLPQMKRLLTSFTASKKQQPSAGAVTLRKAIDAFINEQKVAVATGGEVIAEKPSATMPSKSATSTSSASSSNDPKMQKKLKQLEAQVKKDQQQMDRLKEKLKKAEEDANANNSGGGDTAKATKRVQDVLEKKHKKAVEEANKKHAGAISTIERKLKKAAEELTTLKEELDTLKNDMKSLEKKSGNLKSIEKELEASKKVGAEVDELRSKVSEDEKVITKLNADYSEEKAKRKKYWNMIEDMKGKIRVYSRCRPFNKLEKEQGSTQCVKFVDETTLEVEGPRGVKDYTYDGVFSPSQSQEEVYEDTSHLITSAIDGYNVCLFAYGQTGSGKTWTMTGDVTSEVDQGITPRAMKQLFSEIDDIHKRGVAEVKVSTYFVELYNDQLVDLYFRLDHKKYEKPPKLEIKVDAKKVVVIKNAIIKDAADFEELNSLFDRGNKQRHVGATRMNAGSSRSHSVFSILIENKDLNTGKVSSGKLSLVDLAGSERADKTGATGERLHEATSINTSLSALGDVISALCRNDPYIPIRNNKLTQVLQDGLGGNAKTLMFVNISPADYNASETMSSLDYASRVKQIKNSATKTQEGEEVARLRDIIKRLKGGKPVDDDEINKVE